MISPIGCPLWNTVNIQTHMQIGANQFQRSSLLYFYRYTSIGRKDIYVHFVFVHEKKTFKRKLC